MPQNRTEPTHRRGGSRLRREGLGVLCKDEPDRFSHQGERMSIFLITSFVIGDILYLSSETGLSLIVVLPAFVFGLAVGGLVAGPRLMAIVVSLGWLVTVVLQLAKDPERAAATHGIPFLLVVAGFAAVRIAPFIRGAPLLLPVALVVLFAPLFSDNLWQAASEIESSGFVILLALTVMPLLAALLPQLDRVSKNAFVRVTKGLDRDATIAEATKKIEKRADADDIDAPDAKEVEAYIRPAFESGFVASEAPKIQAALQRSLRWRLLRSLVPLTLGLGLCITFYIYILAWVVISGATAARWVSAAVPFYGVPLLGFDVPAGPYIEVAGLMGILATAIFFAFVITDEEKYVTTLSDLLIHAPLKEAAAFALPYARVRETEGAPCKRPQSR